MIKSLIGKLSKPFKEQSEWNRRIRDVLDCPDNKLIPRVTNAGLVENGFQVMHNGLKVKKGGYYGKGITKMLVKNRGVHEPQEERVFQEVVKHLPKNSVMVELGSYWSFYSMWFLNEITQAKTYLYEPELTNLETGKLNYKANNFTGDFNHALIDDVLKLDTKPPTLTVDYIINNKEIGFIDLLHCDIQGFELAMLKGSANSIEKGMIGYFFISTHSNDLHKSCINFLIKHNYIIISEADLSNSYSLDGLIVARSKNYYGVLPISIAHKL